MVGWRTIRLILLTILLMSGALGLSLSQLFGFSPRALLVTVSERNVPGSIVTPAPGAAPQTFDQERSVIPFYPPLTVNLPAAPVFAASAPADGLTPTPALASFIGRATSASGNCLARGGTIPSSLPDCVISDERPAAARSE